MDKNLRRLIPYPMIGRNSGVVMSKDLFWGSQNGFETCTDSAIDMVLVLWDSYLLAEELSVDDICDADLINEIYYCEPLYPDICKLFKAIYSRRLYNTLAYNASIALVLNKLSNHPESDRLTIKWHV